MTEPRRTASSNHDEIRVLQNGSIEIRDLIDERTAQAKADVEALEKLMLEKFGGVNQRFDAQKEALILAQAEAEKNYHRLNELREKCISTNTYQQGHDALSGRVTSVELSLATRETQIQTIGAMCVRLDVLERDAAKQEGKASMNSVYVLGIGTAVGWLIAIAGLVHSFMK